MNRMDATASQKTGVHAHLMPLPLGHLDRRRIVVPASCSCPNSRSFKDQLLCMAKTVTGCSATDSSTIWKRRSLKLPALEQSAHTPHDDAMIGRGPSGHSQGLPQNLDRQRSLRRLTGASHVTPHVLRILQSCAPGAASSH